MSVWVQLRLLGRYQDSGMCVLWLFGRILNSRRYRDSRMVILHGRLLDGCRYLYRGICDYLVWFWLVVGDITG